MDNFPPYEDHFTVLIDFLGFSEVSKETNDETRRRILSLLIAISSLRGDFNLTTQNRPDGYGYPR